MASTFSMYLKLEFFVFLFTSKTHYINILIDFKKILDMASTFSMGPETWTFLFSFFHQKLIKSFVILFNNFLRYLFYITPSFNSGDIKFEWEAIRIWTNSAWSWPTAAKCNVSWFSRRYKVTLTYIKWTKDYNYRDKWISNHQVSPFVLSFLFLF